jgi:hypothetical protein
MHFRGSEDKNTTYEIDNNVSGKKLELEESNCERDLGVNIFSDLKWKWKNHINVITSKANKILVSENLHLS